MTDTLRETLVTLPRPLDTEAHVFPEREPQVLTRSFARLVGRLGLKNLRFHDLRHDAASTLTVCRRGPVKKARSAIVVPFGPWRPIKGCEKHGGK